MKGISIATIACVTCVVALIRVNLSATTTEQQAMNLTVRVTSPIGEGTGVIFHRDGNTVYIMTARHVVNGDSAAQRPTVSVYFNQARAEAFSATVDAQQSERLDLAVLRVSVPARILGDLDFHALGDTERLARGNQVYPLGHLNDRLYWWHPATPVILSRRLGDQITFESPASKMTGFSGGGLFDSEWGLIGLIAEDSPPETFALSIDAVLDQLRRWRYDVSLSRAADTRRPITPGGVSFGTGNVIYTTPLGWATIEQPDGSIVLRKPSVTDTLIVILPGQPLSRRFEDMFQEGLNKIPPQTLTTRTTTIQADEGFHVRFVEGTTLVNLGGLTKPEMGQMNFIYMGFDPVGRYESVIYLSNRYEFEVDRKIFDEFLRSLDFRNSQDERRSKSAPSR